MSIQHELAIVRYLLESCGDKDAVDTAKAADPNQFQSEACRRAVKVCQQCLSQGVWPTKEDITAGIDEQTAAVLEDAMASQRQVIDPMRQLGYITEEWQRNRQIDILAKSYHALKKGETNIEEILHKLASTQMATGSWQRRSLVDILADVEAGKPLDVSLKEGTAVKTGIREIDRVLAAPLGSYGFLSGMPGSGKTSLMFQMAVLTAANGYKVSAMSLETPKSTLEAKAVATLLASMGQDAFVGTLLKQGIRCRVPLGNIANNLDVAFHPAGLKYESLEAVIRNDAVRGFQVFMIDYFSLLEPPSGTKNEHSQAAEMTIRFKALAAELRVAILIIMQPSDEIGYGEKPLPNKMSKSRQVFRDVDYALLLWSPQKENLAYQETRGKQKRLLKCQLFKNRLFNLDEAVRSDPEVWIEAELRKNWFREINEPMDVAPEVLLDEGRLG
jgi:archaellum biogenesis ATPase FlaH